MIDSLTLMLTSPLMVRSLLIAVLVGVSAPIVGTYLVHRRLSMLGDGIGHVALTGVALGWLAGTAANATPVDQWAIPGALVVSLIGALTIEAVRSSGKTSADVALAMLFYGGIAGGVLLMSIAGGTSAQLNSYLFGSISTVSWEDVTISAVLTLLIVAVGVGCAPALYAISHDEEFARSTGLPVRMFSMVIALMAALTVAVSMRVVGALLVSAIMIIPVAISQLFAKGFMSTMMGASAIGTLVSLIGLSITYFLDISPGAMIVVLSIAVYATAFIGRGLYGRLTRATPSSCAPESTPAYSPDTLHIPAPVKGTYMQRMTKQRLAVFEELQRLDDFRSAQQIFDDLQRQGQKVGLATVYRNLQALTDSGHVDVVRSGDGESLFRYCKTEEHHHHLVCKNCGTTREIEQHDIESWVSNIAAVHGFVDVEHHMELFGFCADCHAELFGSSAVEIGDPA